MVWTGRRCTAPSLLYLSYNDLATVTDEDGRWIGEILHLPNGYYLPRVDGIRGDDCATADSALRKVVELHKKFRS